MTERERGSAPCLKRAGEKCSRLQSSEVGCSDFVVHWSVRNRPHCCLSTRCCRSPKPALRSGSCCRLEWGREGNGSFRFGGRAKRSIGCESRCADPRVDEFSKSPVSAASSVPTADMGATKSVAPPQFVPTPDRFRAWTRVPRDLPCRGRAASLRAWRVRRRPVRNPPPRRLRRFRCRSAPRGWSRHSRSSAAGSR